MSNQIDMNAAAAALYDGGAAQRAERAGTSQQNAAARPAPATEDVAQTLFDKTETGARPDGLDKVYHTTQRDIITASTQRFGLEDAEAKEIAQHWGTTFSTYGIDPSEASTLSEVGAAALENPPDDATIAGWARDARTAVKGEFGATADLALDDARRLVAADPKLSAFLDETGLGSHPHVVLAAAKAGRRARTSGRLK